MNTGVGKQNATATAKTTSETHVHRDGSLSQMRPCQAWRLVPQLRGVHGGRRGSNLSNVRIHGWSRRSAEPPKGAQFSEELLRDIVRSSFNG